MTEQTPKKVHRPELTCEQKLERIYEAANHALKHLVIPDQTITVYLLQIASLSDKDQLRLHEDWLFSHRGDFD